MKGKENSLPATEAIEPRRASPGCRVCSFWRKTSQHQSRKKDCLVRQAFMCDPLCNSKTTCSVLEFDTELLMDESQLK